QHGVRRGEVSVEVVRQVPSSGSCRAVESSVVSTAAGPVSMNKVSVGAVSPSGGAMRRSSFQSALHSPLIQQQQHLQSGRPSPQPNTTPVVHHPSPQPAHVQPSPQASPHILHQPSPQASPQPVLLHQSTTPQQQQQLVSIGGQLHQVVTTTVGGAATSVLVHPSSQQVVNVAPGANVIVSRGGELESITRTVQSSGAAVVQQPSSLSIAVSSSHPPPAHLNKNRPPLDTDPSMQPFDMSLAPQLYRGGYYVQEPHRQIYGAGAVLDMKMEGSGDKGQDQQQQTVTASHVVLAQHGASPHMLPAHHDRATESPKVC
ncbi:hypothetical protein FHG87_025473, partial [Trinorchestia longiramus]